MRYHAGPGFRSRVHVFVLVGLVALLALAVGCSSRDNLKRSLTVTTCPLLTELGVTVDDWTYSDQTLSVKLKASKDFGDPWVISPQTDNGQAFSEWGQFSLKAGESGWIDFGGPKSPYRFELKPQTKVVTIYCKQRHFMKEAPPARDP